MNNLKLNEIFKFNQNSNKFNSLSINTLPSSMCQSVIKKYTKTSLLKYDSLQK